MNRMENDWRGRDDYDDLHHKCCGCDTLYHSDDEFEYIMKLDEWFCRSCAYDWQMTEGDSDE